MTNKEAIKELVNLEFYARPFDNSVEASIEANNKIEAVRLAIKALKDVDRLEDENHQNFVNSQHIISSLIEEIKKLKKEIKKLKKEVKKNEKTI